MVGQTGVAANVKFPGSQEYVEAPDADNVAQDDAHREVVLVVKVSEGGVTTPMDVVFESVQPTVLDPVTV